MRFENQVFQGGEVTLDYNEFVDCVFRDCLLVFHGGEFSLVRVRFEQVRFGLAGAANNTLMFLRLVRANGPQLVEELLGGSAELRADQSVTIN